MSLYLKYRPQDFDSLVGQDFVKETLKKAISSDKTVWAYLFCGPRWTWKTSTARIFAKAINCENQKDWNPCNNCKICNAINNENLVDVIEIDAASNTWVDNIRDLIEKAQYTPSQAKYKVYIIDEVHMLSKGAFNALLKILEEPPKYLKFILATTETHKVPETIISRCQRYDFKNISQEDLKKRLKYIAEQENIKIDKESLDYIVKNSNWWARNAISLFEQLIIDWEIKYENIIKNLGILDKKELDLFLEKLEKKDNSIIDDFEKLISDGKNIKLFFKDLIFHTKEKIVQFLKENKDYSILLKIIETLDETYSKTKNSLDENTTFLIGILKILNWNYSNTQNNTIKEKKNNTSNVEWQIPKSQEITPKWQKEKLEIIDKCPAYWNIDDEYEEELDLDTIWSIFWEENNQKQETPLQETNSNFDKNKFLEELKKAWVKWLIISSLKQSEITLNWNTLTITFKTNFVKNQFNKEENIASVKNILENMGFKECNVKLS